MVSGYLTSISDIHHWSAPVDTMHRKCMVSFKAIADGKWYNGTGEASYSSAQSEDDACRIALEHGKEELVARVFGKKIHGEETMVCDETPPPATRPVKIGEIVKLSDVNPHLTKTMFKYQGVLCHWFIETNMEDKDLYQYQGIICKTARPGFDTWQVVDKF
jgi:uncharacterized protein YodC (DUF2158 family)